MAYRLSTDTRNKACDAVVDDIDAGAGAWVVGNVDCVGSAATQQGTGSVSNKVLGGLVAGRLVR